MITESSDANITNGGLELYKWVCFVVVIGWAGLAICAEVGVMADSALETIARDVTLNTIV